MGRREYARELCRFESELGSPGAPRRYPATIGSGLELLDEGKHGLELGSPGPLQELVNHHLG